MWCAQALAPGAFTRPLSPLVSAPPESEPRAPAPHTLGSAATGLVRRAEALAPGAFTRPLSPLVSAPPESEPHAPRRPLP